VILDIFSRYVVGWMIAPWETAELAEQLIADTVTKHQIEPGTHGSPCRPGFQHAQQAGGGLDRLGCHQNP